jgi:hypothetical protein
MSLITNVRNAFGSVLNVGKKIISATTLKAPAGKRIIGGVVPLTPAGTGTAALGLAKTGTNVVKAGINVIKRQFTNPFAGATVKQGLTNVGKRLAGYSLTGALFGASYTGAKGLITGQTPSIRSIAKGAEHGLTVGLNPFGAAIGTIAGLGEKYADVAKSSLPQDYFDQLSNRYRSFPPPANITYNFPEFPPPANITYNFPEFPQMQMPQYQMPENVSLPSVSSGFSPSFSVDTGGGMAENLPLLLLLLGAGGLGAYAIRKKRKKKKYKKRKKH